MLVPLIKKKWKNYGWPDGRKLWHSIISVVIYLPRRESQRKFAILPLLDLTLTDEQSSKKTGLLHKV